MANEIVVGFESGHTLYTTIWNTSGEVWCDALQDFEDWGTGSRTADDYAVTLTDKSGGMFMGDFPSTIPNGNYYLIHYVQAGASPADSDIPYTTPVAKTWSGSTLVDTPVAGAPGTNLTCSEMIDEIQLRVGRPSGRDIVDTTWCTRVINEAQRIIAEQVTVIPSLAFDNKTSHDTTGTHRYTLTDITIGDTTTDRQPCRVTDIWYLDGNESCKLRFLPVDEFDFRYPDPTHSDMPFGKPKYWTQRNNTTVETYPYCASAYWDKDLRFTGYFWPAEFTTDATRASDISRADEGMILYGVWKAWKAIGSQEGIMESVRAKKEWTNPNPSYGEDIGWLEHFRDGVEMMIPWESNLYA